MIFPVPAIERRYSDLRGIDAIETPKIDAVPIRVGARNIKRLDAAAAAEQMSRSPRIEAVLRQLFCALYQPEPGRRHNQMQKPREFADRTVALVDFHRHGCVNLETDRATMTPAFISRQIRGTVG